MMEDKLTILLEINDKEYGKVILALNKQLKEVCVIDGKIEENPDIIYEIKLRNRLCRDKEIQHFIE